MKTKKINFKVLIVSMLMLLNYNSFSQLSVGNLKLYDSSKEHNLIKIKGEDFNLYRYKEKAFEVITVDTNRITKNDLSFSYYWVTINENDKALFYTNYKLTENINLQDLYLYYKNDSLIYIQFKGNKLVNDAIALKFNVKLGESKMFEEVYIRNNEKVSIIRNIKYDPFYARDVCKSIIERKKLLFEQEENKKLLKGF